MTVVFGGRQVSVKKVVLGIGHFTLLVVVVFVFFRNSGICDQLSFIKIKKPHTLHIENKKRKKGGIREHGRNRPQSSPDIFSGTATPPEEARQGFTSAVSRETKTTSYPSASACPRTGETQRRPQARLPDRGLGRRSHLDWYCSADHQDDDGDEAHTAFPVPGIGRKPDSTARRGRTQIGTARNATGRRGKEEKANQAGRKAKEVTGRRRRVTRQLSIAHSVSIAPRSITRSFAHPETKVRTLASIESRCERTFLRVPVDG